MPAYRIESGVRRCVAAIRAGRIDIPAIIFYGGHPSVRCRIGFDELYSPKSSVPRDGRYITNTEYPTLVLGTDPPEIELSPLDARHLRYYTPIHSVTLT